MDSLSPQLKLIQFLRWRLQLGQSVASAIKDYCRIEEGGIQRHLILLVNELSSSQSSASFQRSHFKRPITDALWFVIRRGWAGGSILEELKVLEAECTQQDFDHLEDCLRKLPLKSLFPVMCFHVPAFLFLLFVPLLSEFTRFLGGV